MTLRGISTIHSTIARNFLNAVLVFIFFNVLLFASRLLIPGNLKQPPPEVPTYQDMTIRRTGFEGITQESFEKIMRVYYYMDVGEIIELIMESSNVTLTCDAFSPYREAPFRGLYVNVDENGFRWLHVGDENKPPWPIIDDEFVIFIFGGSSTFGYGVGDNLTVSAWLEYYLQEAFNVVKIRVYNFGRAGFSSFEEKILFTSLVEAGYIPDMAIFFDGLNDFRRWSGEVRADVGCSASDSVNMRERFRNMITCDADEICLPVQILAENLTGNFDDSDSADTIDLATGEPPKDDLETNLAIIDRWLSNKIAVEQVARQNQVELLFVMEPAPMYGYNLKNHLFIDSVQEDDVWSRHHWGYTLWEERYNDADSAWTDNVLNLVRLGEDNEGPIYVDRIHYTSWFSEEIAIAIKDYLIQENRLNLPQ